MIQWRLATVVASVREGEKIQELIIRLDGEKGHASAIHYKDVFSSLRPGDRVVVNATAVELGLGSGGVHFVHYPLKLGGHTDLEGHISLPNDPQGHIMKLRYTSLQRAVLSVEEPASQHHSVFTSWKTLENMPVLIGELHSMLPVLVCWLRHLGKKRKRKLPAIVYIMTDGGALPLPFSRHVRTLKELGWLKASVTYGHAYGGDAEAVNKFTALVASRHVFGADIAIVAMGPGIVGTGTLLGTSGMETGEIINAVGILGGIPVYVPRLSGAEMRGRHYGMSHHSWTILSKISLARSIVPLPKGIPEPLRDAMEKEAVFQDIRRIHEVKWIHLPSDGEIERALAEYPFPVETMGRTFQADPLFFRGICAAAQCVWNIWNKGKPTFAKENEHEQKVRPTKKI